jgi:predicted RND superfamily exporter protein
VADDTHFSNRLEHAPHPAAIVHEGFFVHANRMFLDKLGCRELEDLQAIPLLDAVDDRHHQRLREHLAEAKKTAGTDTQPAQAQLDFIRTDSLPISALCTSFRTRYGGEDCVQINLETSDTTGIGGRIRSLPWRHYFSLLFLLLFTILPSTFLLKLNINNAPDAYFPDNEPAVVLDRELRKRFPNDQVFVLLFEGVALFSDGFLEAYDELGQQLLKLESINDVISVTTQDHIRGSESDFVVEALIDAKDLENSRPDDRRQRLLSDELSRDALTNSQASALAMVVIPQKTGNSIERLALEDHIMSLVREERLEGYLAAVAGQISVDVAQLRSMLRDNMFFIPATVTIGLGLIWWLFRRMLAVMLAGVAIGVVVNTTVAFYVLFDQPFTLVSSIIPPLLSALTVAALIHLFNGLYLSSKRGLSGAQRIKRALEEVNRPALFAALTTAGGLASLASSPVVPIKMFGLISAAGTVLIYIVVFRILPNIILRWDKTPWVAVRGSAGVIDQLVGVLYRTGMRYPAWVIGITVTLLAVTSPQLANVKVETNLQEFFEYEHPVRQDTRYIDEQLIGTMPVSVIFDAPRRDGLTDPETLQAIQDFQDWAESQPEIDRSFGMTDFIAEMHWAFNAEDPEFRRLPDSQALIAQYLLIYDGDDIYDFVDRDLQHSQVTLNLNVHSANAISDVLQRTRAYLEEHIDGDLHWEIAGMGRLFADMEDLLVAGQVYSLWSALGLIFLFLLIFLRSVGAALLCMIPNLSPILLIFVIMGIAGIWLDMATAIIASVAIGIAVDDTLHVYHGFRRRIALGIHPVMALARTYRGAGRAVVVTTIILSAQFLILVFSDFVPTRNFGLLTTIGLLTALLFDLVLLPAILLFFHHPDSPLARLRRRGGGVAAVEPAAATDPGLDAGYWTPQRRAALTREIISGRIDETVAAKQYALPAEELADWLARAEQAIDDAFVEKTGRKTLSSEKERKLKALVKAYRRLKAENRELKTRITD